MKCRYPHCDDDAQARFTIRLRGGYIVSYCDTHLKEFLANGAAKARVQSAPPAPRPGVIPDDVFTDDGAGYGASFALGVGDG